MFISLNWLKDFVDIPKRITPEDLMKSFTLKTAEVESINTAGKGLEGVVIGEILEISKHPNADKLSVAKVNVGKTKPIQLCFGNMVKMEVGFRVPVAVAPTILPTGVEILKRDLRGVMSEGMLCLDQELGFKKEGVSIQFFPKTVNPGTLLADLLSLNDTVFEFDNKSLTHRPDLWGHYGLAREVSAIYKLPFKKLAPKSKIPTTGEKIKVTIDEYELCQRYCGVIIKNVKIKESPKWMRDRLHAAGHETYNNIVDVTNYISSELGQPLHAFDKRLVAGGIHVRTATKNETITTLDGKERKLKETMLLIADDKKPLAIAGIMGGENSGVKDDTTEIIIESATFNGANVRRTSTELGLRTEAVQRFEKQLDPNLSLFAMLRAIELVLEVSPGAVVAGPTTDNHKFDEKPRKVTISLDKISSKIGLSLPKAEMLDILKRLEFKTVAKTNAKAKDLYEVTIPSFRAQKDVSMADDIVEEIARIHGYEEIPPLLPELPAKLPHENLERTAIHQLRKFLAYGLSFNETPSYSFYSKADIAACLLHEESHILIENYLSEDQTHMRTTLAPNMLKRVALNTKYEDHFKLFEIGRTYKDLGKNESTYFPLEENWLIGAITIKTKHHYKCFYEAKNAALEILKQANIPPTKLVQGSRLTYAHPLKSATILTHDGKTLGHVYTIHPQVSKNLGLEKYAVAMFELNLTELNKTTKLQKKFKELPKFQSIVIDVSVLVNNKKTITELIEAILKADSRLIKDVTLFDFYTGENLGPANADKKSVAFKITLQSPDKTLTDAEMTATQKQIFENLQKLGGQIRGL